MITVQAMTRFSILLSLLLLAACAKGTTQTPTISAAELSAEQQAQRQILNEEKSRQTSAAETQNVDQMLARLKRVASRVSTAGQQVCAELRVAQCSFPFVLDAKGTEVNAYTDGKQIIITPPMMKFAYDDTQLATVLSHEFAHAVMKHPGKTQQNVTIGGLLGMAVDTLAGSQGLNTGSMFSKLGAQGAVMRYSQGFEREADYVGMYILVRSGYNINEAATLWRRMAALNPDGIYNGTTHPTTAERYLLLSKTANEIAQKQQSGQPVLPNPKLDDDSLF